MSTYGADLLDTSGHIFAMLFARIMRAIERQITAAQDHGTRYSFFTTSKSCTFTK